MSKEIEQKRKWRKIGGGMLRLLDGRRIKPNEHFEAYESDIPKAFLNVLEEVSGRTRERKAEPKKVEKKVEKQEPTKEQPKQKPIFEKKHMGGGKWNVVNTEGKAINEELLNKQQAEDLITQLS